MSEYSAPFFLPGGHLQTLAAGLPVLFDLDYRRERWDIPHPRDFIDVDWAGGDREELLVVFHGLEGHSRSRQVQRLGAHVIARGWRFAAPHFRGCSEEPNLQLQSYHAGSSDEVGLMLERFRAGHAGPIFAAGISLGANALLKWLGEQGADAARLVSRAVAISAPLNLETTGAVLARGFSWFYAGSFLANYLRQRALDKSYRFEGAYDARCVRAARLLREFEDAVTAPVHHFEDVHDYWTRSSSMHFLEHIRVPTLVLNARNDPFTPDHVLRAIEVFRERDRLPPEVTLDFQDEGGHAGFVGDDDWLVKRVYAFLTA